MSYLEKMARLHTLVISYELRVKENPLPYLQEAYTEMYKLQEILEKVYRILKPDPIAVLDTDKIEYTDYRDEAFERCEKAKKFLDEYLSMEGII